MVDLKHIVTNFCLYPHKVPVEVNLLGGDPCLGTPKLLKVKYIHASGKLEEYVAADHSTAFIEVSQSVRQSHFDLNLDCGSLLTSIPNKTWAIWVDGLSDP